MGNNISKILKVITHKQLKAFIILCAYLLGGMLFPTKASAAPLGDINLYPAVPHIRQTQSSWAGLPMKNLPVNQSPAAPTYGECGCLLAALSSMVNFYIPIFNNSVPRFPVQLQGELRPTLNWSPAYIDHFLRCGSPPNRSEMTVGFDPCLLGPDTNWGYKNVSNSCGVMPQPWALENMAISRAFSNGDGTTIQTPTGVTTMHYTLSGLNRQGAALISYRLSTGQPSIVITKARAIGGEELDVMHAYVIVGHDALTQQYLVLDPGLYGDTGAEFPVSRNNGTYEGWLQDIVGIITMAPVINSQHHLSFIDDPSPIDYAIINPEGHRTGHNPTNRTEEHGVANAFTYTLGTEANLLGNTEDTVEAKSLQIDNPANGTWRTEIIGTGTGPYDVDIVTVNAGIPTKHQTLNGTITTGQKIKHEINYQLGKPPVITAVNNFTPEAVLGDSRSARAGQNLTFDGKRSWDADSTITGWNWDFGDGTTASGSRQTHAFTAEGEYTVKLTVTDNLGASSTRSIKVAITPRPTIAAERSSISSEEIQGNTNSGMTLTWPNWVDKSTDWLDTLAISRDGRFTAFQSLASNLVANDTNGQADVFVRDQTTGTTTRVSINTSGSQFGGPSGIPRISANGRYVAFVNGGNVYLHDCQTNTTEAVNLNASDVMVPTGSSAVLNWTVITGAISPDGRYVLFSTNASLAPEDTNGLHSVYLRDRQTSTTEWVSQGTEFTTGAWEPAMSDDASKIVFTTQAESTDGDLQIFLKNRASGAISRVSAKQDGTPSSQTSKHPVITPDGRYVAFHNIDLDPVGTQVMIKDLQTGEVKGVKGAQSNDNGMLIARPSISNDGRYVLAGVPSRLPLRFGNTYEAMGFGIFDRQDGSVRRVDLTQQGALPNITGGSYSAMSGDARWVAFSSFGSTFIPFDTNGVPDVYVRDMQTAVPPTADVSGPYIGWARNNTHDTGITMTFDGSLSADPSGAPLKYIWDFGDGSPTQTTTTKTTTHPYMTPGKYTVKLVVDNGGEKSAPATTEVTIYAQPTETDIKPSLPSCTAPGTEIVATGTGTVPFATRTGWNLMNGPMPNSQNAIFPSWGGRYDYTARPPLYEYSVRISVPVWLQGTFKVSDAPLQIPCAKAANMPPLPDAGGPYTAAANTSITLDGSASQDPENATLSYVWDFGDSTPSNTSAKPTHTYSTPGVYYASVTVSDGEKTTKPSLGYGYAKVVVTEAVGVTIATDTNQITAPEGSAMEITGTFVGPKDQAVTLSSSSGSVQDTEDGHWKWSDTAPDGPAEKTVTITATAASGQTASVSIGLVITNVAPSIQAIDTGTIGTACVNGTHVTMRAVLTDPAGEKDPLTGTVDWGDGTTTQFTGAIFESQHTYAPGTYKITIHGNDDDGGSATRSSNPGQVSALYATSALLQPINPGNSSNFKLGSTIPLKIIIADCSGTLVTTAQPTIKLAMVGPTHDIMVNEVVSSSAADTGNTMRLSGNQYVFNLSTKNSQFHDGNDLEPGRYKLTISEPSSTTTEAFFDLLP